MKCDGPTDIVADRVACTRLKLKPGDIHIHLFIAPFTNDYNFTKDSTIVRVKFFYVISDRITRTCQKSLSTEEKGEGK